MTNLNFLSKSSSQSCGHSSVTLASTVGSPSVHRRSTMLRLLSVLVLVLTFGVGNVWGTTATITTGTYTKQNSVSVTENGSYIFMFGTTTSAYIMTNENASSSNYVAKSSQYTNLPSSITITNSNKNLVWVASDYNNGNFKLCGPNGYCYCQGTSKLAANQNSSSTWHIGTTSNVIYLIDGNNCYIKDAGANGFRAYSTTQNRTQLVAVYKLAASYTISAQSNNTNYGTVSGTSTITASPETGYRVSTTTPYTVSPANSATVTQDGNSFSVTASANTTITINFEEIPTYTLNYHDGNGNNTRTNVYEGTNLIDALGTPAASCDAASTTFVGWSTTEIATKTNTAPTYVSDDAVVNSTTAAATYYAVYAKGTETQTPIANSWTRITSTSQLTDGATVMLVQYYSDYAINTNPGATSCTANAEITNSNTSLRWIAEQSGTKWKFKTSASKYLSTSALDNNTGLSLDATYDEWTITVDNGGGTGSNNTYNNANCFKLNNGSDLEYYSNTFKLYTWSLKYSSAYPFYIYIQKTNSSVSYSDYITTCCQPLCQINGSFLGTTHFGALSPEKFIPERP